MPVFAEDNIPTRKVVAAAAACDTFVTSYKAPHARHLDSILRGGSSPAGYPGNGACFSFNPATALPYTDAYGTGVLVVNTRLSVLTSLVGSGQILVDPAEPGAFRVVPSALPAFTAGSTVMYVPSLNLQYYEMFLK